MSDYLELAYSSIRVFADDGSMDLEELNFLLGIALRDGEIDEDEKRVLRNIFKQAEAAGLTPRTRERIAEVRRLHSL